MEFMNDNLYGDVQQNRRRRRTYRLRRIINNDTFSEEDIRQRYRFSREGIFFLVNLLRGDLTRLTQRNNALSVETQVLFHWDF